MACGTLTMSFGFRCPPPTSSSARVSYGSVQFAPFNKMNSLKLSWSSSISGFGSILPQNLCTVTPHPRRPRTLTIVSAKRKKPYKMKTNKAAAKRFRVTGSGKILRRKSGKQHLQYKKSYRRKARLSKMVEVDRSDYKHVMKLMPYLKVNRKAT